MSRRYNNGLSRRSDRRFEDSCPFDDVLPDLGVSDFVPDPGVRLRNRKVDFIDSDPVSVGFLNFEIVAEAEYVDVLV